MDAVQFVVATNPGSAAGAIDKIASGGELSRFMLAIKVVLAATSHVPVLVFDEVDAGMGGATVLGPIVLGLSKSVQICPLSASVSQILNMATFSAYEAPLGSLPPGG